LRRGARSVAMKKFYITASLAVSIGLSAMAMVGAAVAQDAAKAESAAQLSPTVEETSDRGRHHRRKQDDTAKSAKSTVKPKAADKTDAAAKTPTASTSASSAAAVVKPEQECRTVTPTGSRMFKKICATPEQWKEVDDRGVEGARQTKQTLNDSSAIARPTPPAMPGGGFAP
jgi:hypothetical protein